MIQLNMIRLEDKDKVKNSPEGSAEAEKHVTLSTTKDVYTV